MRRNGIDLSDIVFYLVMAMILIVPPVLFIVRG